MVLLRASTFGERQHEKHASKQQNDPVFCMFRLILCQVEGPNHDIMLSAHSSQRSKRRFLHRLSARFCVNQTEDDAQHPDAG